MYKQGIYPETPEGINTKWFHKTIRQWYRIEEAQGPDALRHKGINKVWIPEEKLDLVSKVLDGKSIKSTAIEAGINHGMLYQWVHKSVKEYIDYYNNERIQAKTKWIPPIKYREASMR